MRGLIKSITADKYLSPIRYQISNLVIPNSSVVEFGCGNGDLLCKLSNKISYGLGVDNSKSLIKYAILKSKELEKSNLSFKVFDVKNIIQTSKKYDYAIASLLLHLLPWETSLNLLESMLKIADNIIICSFTNPENTKERVLLHLDQLFSQQYLNFNCFIKNKSVKGLLEQLNISESNVINIKTFDKSIEVYTITNKKID